MSKRPSIKPHDIEQALVRLVSMLRTTDAEFPDAAWRIASSYCVDYESLVDAYDEYCANQ